MRRYKRYSSDVIRALRYFWILLVWWVLSWWRSSLLSRGRGGVPLSCLVAEVTFSACMSAPKRFACLSEGWRLVTLIAFCLVFYLCRFVCFGYELPWSWGRVDKFSRSLACLAFSFWALLSVPALLPGCPVQVEHSEVVWLACLLPCGQFG